MKKHFILLSTFVALLLSATLLTACGEEVQELADNGNNGESVAETTVGENCTLFSTGDDGTRTALGYNRKFYWSEGDQIYVNTDGSQYEPSLNEYSEVVFTKLWAELTLAESSANLATDYSGVEVELVEVPANSGNLSFRAYASLTDDNARANYHNVTSLTNTLSFSAVTQDPIRRVSIVWRDNGTASLKIRHVYLIKKDGTKEEVTPTSRNACTITPVSIPGSSGSTGPQYARTSKSTLSSNKETADFVLKGVSLTAPKCSVVYIGNGTTAARPKASDLKVKIEDTQTQTAWGDSAHIGRAGDCGVAVAIKNGGKYTFSLRHKASYLVFQPYRFSGQALNWKLMKIEIIANGTTLAGTYDFGTGELVGTGSSNTIELNCGTDGFDLNHTAASNANSCFVVIQPSKPGTKHELTIRYTVKVPGKENVYLIGPHGGDFGTMFFEKKISERSYNANDVTIIKHKLELTPTNSLFYKWGDEITYLESYATNGNNYNMTFENLPPSHPVFGGLPNANEMAWYVLRGDPHWDANTVVSMDGGLTDYTTGGLWLLKKNYISGFNASTDPTGRNLLESGNADAYAVSPTEGKPANAAANYFFLPALGFYNDGSLKDVGSKGAYWTRSNFNNGVSNSYNLHFGRDYRAYVSLALFIRWQGLVVAPAWFK